MSKVRICEVGPRDGFQNIKEYISVGDKLHIIDGLIQSGVTYMEVTSFVSPKAIPQLKDAKEIVGTCLKKYPDVEFMALIPNLRGAQTAVETGIKKVAYVVSLSASHNKANINRTHEQSYNSLKEIMETYPQLDICLDLATAFGCPFEGKLKALQTSYPQLKLAVHIHDTRGMGLACTLAAIEMGVTDVQSTLGGLGGCPFAPGASGNLATEDLVYMLNEMGFDTGIDFEKILNLAKEEIKLIPSGVYSGHHIHIDKTSKCFR